MNSLTWLHAVTVLLAAGLAAVAIRSPRSLTLRSGAVVLAGLLMAAGYAGYAELLGRPKPAGFEWAERNVAEADVIAAQLREGEAIYLWLRLQGDAEPRAYALPWSMQVARQLHRAQSAAERRGTGVRMRGPFRQSREEGERMFYVAPQPPLPPKMANAR